MNVNNLRDGRWVSVDDASPNRCEGVIVWARANKDDSFDTHEGFIGSEGEWNLIREEYVGRQIEATHWMHFPKGPNDGTTTAD